MTQHEARTPEPVTRSRLPLKSNVQRDEHSSITSHRHIWRLGQQGATSDQRRRCRHSSDFKLARVGLPRLAALRAADGQQQCIWRKSRPRFRRQWSTTPSSWVNRRPAPDTRAPLFQLTDVRFRTGNYAEKGDDLRREFGGISRVGTSTLTDSTQVQGIRSGRSVGHHNNWTFPAAPRNDDGCGVADGKPNILGRVRESVTSCPRDRGYKAGGGTAPRC